MPAETRDEALIAHTIESLRLMGWTAPEQAERMRLALDAGIDVLVKLSRTGSLRRELREAALKQMWEARQEKFEGV
jgi:plasmid stabilization system protein ParE